MADGLTEKQTASLKEAFDCYDPDETGFIPVDKLGDVVRACGQNPTEADIDDMKQQIDDDGNGVAFDQLLELVTCILKPENEIQDEMLEAFRVFDQDGNGFISKDELRDRMLNLGEKLTDDEVDEMMQAADIDADGRVNYEEFVTMMTTA